jgi:hypothetical protein
MTSRPAAASPQIMDPDTSPYDWVSLSAKLRLRDKYGSIRHVRLDADLFKREPNAAIVLAGQHDLGNFVYADHKGHIINRDEEVLVKPNKFDQGQGHRILLHSRLGWMNDRLTDDERKSLGLKKRDAGFCKPESFVYQNTYVTFSRDRRGTSYVVKTFGGGFDIKAAEYGDLKQPGQTIHIDYLKKDLCEPLPKGNMPPVKLTLCNNRQPSMAILFKENTRQLDCESLIVFDSDGNEDINDTGYARNGLDIVMLHDAYLKPRNWFGISEKEQVKQIKTLAQTYRF